MTKGQEIIEALIEKISGQGGLEDVYDSRILESGRNALMYSVITETGENVTQPGGQKLSPLEVTTQFIVALIAIGGDTSENKQAAITRLRTAQESVEGILLKYNETLDGLIERLNYSGAQLFARGEGEQVSIVREMRFDALWYRHLPVEGEE